MMHTAVNVIFLTAQMSAKRGIKLFGKRAIVAMINEFRQLDKGAFPGKPVIEALDPDTVTPAEIKRALEAVSLIKEKRNGIVKGRVCANGSKQKYFLDPDEFVASPTVSLESLLATLLIDVYEGRSVITFDVPGAYLHAEMPPDKRVIMILRDEFVDMMCEANPAYKKYIKYSQLGKRSST